MFSIKEIWNQFGIPSTEASKELHYTELMKSLEECISTSDYSPFYALLKQHLQIDIIHDSIKAYIESSSTNERLPGPTKIKSCKAYLNFVQFADLFPGSYDRLFPAFYINSNLWLIIPTGALINLHHDATFFEVGSEVLELTNSFEEFINEFSEYGSELSLNQRFHFETSLSDKGLDNFRKIDSKQQEEVLEIYSSILNIAIEDIDVDDMDENVRVACMAYLETAGMY